ncbi:hypothetical protein [Bradyrhizobium prioriisuperbiae]|uniref:hypothetical protein n=1 Tax=Bradyrhizobium prioriisuperbiae TaxID=2854389 RepID=UPI0028F01D79|nr:hypothetical protein [Bradyrhizobium prioritasuperba]
MSNFHNFETKEPLKVLYIGSSGNGNVVLRHAMGLSSFRAPRVIVANGAGTVKPVAMAGKDESRWSFSGLRPGSSIVAIDGNDKVLVQIPVKMFTEALSWKPVNERLNGRGMRIALDDHIDYVCYASDIAGEGIFFRPKSSGEFTAAITDTRMFHHDDRGDPFGRMAASATIGEGYREVSTPSLHVAIHETIASVHIDSFAFMLQSPEGEYVIGPDVGQHIFDELLFRMPMAWLRRKNLPFIASVLQVIHPVLPNSTNRYNSIIGARVALGGTPRRDLKAGMPRLNFESTYDWGPSSTAKRWNHEMTLNIYGGGNTDRGPDWVVGIKGQVLCGDVKCNDREESVGLFLKVGQ